MIAPFRAFVVDQTADGFKMGIRHSGYSEYVRVPGEILSREETEAENTRPLESERWAGSIDTVGGATLAYLMRTTKKGGAIAAIGVAGGAAFRATVSLRVLKGKRWKQLQRLPYPLALLAVAHTFGHQYLNLRGPVLLVMVIIPLVMVLACQGLGIVLTVSQQRRG